MPTPREEPAAPRATPHHAEEARLIATANARRGTREGEAAFGALIEPLRRPLFFQVLRSVGSRERAEEIVQEAFLRTYEALPRFEPRATLRTFVGRIAHNLCTDESRRPDRGARRPLSLDATTGRAGAGDDSPSLAELLRSREASPEERALSAEATREVHRAVAALAPIYREIIQLRVYEDLSYEEIADITGCGVGAAKQRMYQAILNLRGIARGSGNGS